MPAAGASLSLHRIPRPPPKELWVSVWESHLTRITPVSWLPVGRTKSREAGAGNLEGGRGAGRQGKVSLHASAGGGGGEGGTTGRGRALEGRSAHPRHIIFCLGWRKLRQGSLG